MFEVLKGVVAPTKDELMKPAEQALAMANQWSIADDDSYEIAATELRSIKAKAKALEEKRTALTVPLNQVLRGINALFKEPSERLTEAESVIKRGMIAYQDRREAERRAAEAAARAAEEAARKAAEIQSIEQVDGAQQMAALMDEADAAIIAAAGIPAAPAPLKVSGVSRVKTTIKARVIDKAALIAHIAQAPAYLDLVDINESKLNQLAKALGENLKMPGVELVEEKSIAARAA